MSETKKTVKPNSNLRRRARRSSYGNVEEIVRDELIERSKQADEPIHIHADSLLTTTRGFTNLRGLFNLCILLMVLSNTRVALENIFKYGILINPVSWISIFLQDPYNWPCSILLLGSNIFVLYAYFIEILLSQRSVSENLAFCLHIFNWMFVLIFPAFIIIFLHPNPVFSSMTLGIISVMFLKLFSYVSVNRWCRTKKSFHVARIRHQSIAKSLNKLSISIGERDSSEEHIKYPDNLTLPNLYYFMSAPTLCYELNFPRSARIRSRFLIKRSIELVLLLQLIAGLVQQWLIPTISNSMQPFHQMHWSLLLTRLLKLAVPNHIIWLLSFYWFFHSFLNCLAEILRFGDREFYKDWWNAENVTYFWKNWNIPVHRWAMRHVYKPLLKKGLTRFQASVSVFLISAFFHEYLVSIPLQMFRIWAFLAMAMQVPFAYFVAKFFHGNAGNMAVWCSLIIGQPVAILMYWHDYFILNKNDNSTVLAT